jgi:hypothetical protein
MIKKNKRQARPDFLFFSVNSPKTKIARECATDGHLQIYLKPENRKAKLSRIKMEERRSEIMRKTNSYV